MLGGILRAVIASKKDSCKRQGVTRPRQLLPSDILSLIHRRASDVLIFNLLLLGACFVGREPAD